MTRQEALDKIAECVLKDRNNQYGAPEDNFARIAALVTVALGSKLNGPLASRDVALILACVKVGRLAHDVGNLDSWIDLAGYAVCGASLG